MPVQLIPHAGQSEPLGATITPDGVNFAVYSSSASAVFVCLFDEEDRQTARIELDGHENSVFHGLISDVGPGARYGLRADGPYDPDRALHFDPDKLLVDPYATWIDRPFVRSPRLRLPRGEGEDTASIVPKAIVNTGRETLVMPRGQVPGLIYELNVRGYTMKHPSVQGPLRGTIAGLTSRHVIDHLHYLGVDTVELMPVSAWVDDAHLPVAGLTNAWGYNPVSYFALDPRLAPRGPQELRTLTDRYREAGISVILDVVYNHTGEGDADGPVLSLKGLDAGAYYRHVEADGKQVLVNDTGTGNTLQCDHPAVQKLVLDSLKYWVQQGGVSGFRFDLATILGRTAEGFDPNAKMLELIRTDPVLSKCLLVAEPWDPGPGGYHLGAFGPKFHEWNDKYRDEVRAFWRGDIHRIGSLAHRVAGSDDLFSHADRKPSAGVNFLAVHDGFTLRDLVSYEHKHNEANGENNRDGHDHNNSWNCGVEGATDDPTVLEARRRDVRALLATLFVSRGTPLLAQGDEMGRTQQGNNNAYAQDNDITWLDWANADGALVDYVASLNTFRHEHPALTRDVFLTGKAVKGVRDVVWLHPEGHELTAEDWEAPNGGVLGMWLGTGSSEVLVWFNRETDDVAAALPKRKGGKAWQIGLASDDSTEPDITSGVLNLPARSVVVLV